MKIDRIIRTKRRTISLIVENDGTLTVRAPKRTPNVTIQGLVKAKEKWIIKKQNQVKAANARYQQKKFIEGEQFLYLGKLYPLKIVDTGNEQLDFNGKFLISKSAIRNAEGLFIDWYRQQAHSVILERVKKYSRKFNLKYKHLKITSAKKRWGSCSSNGSLNFPWRLVMAPIQIIDYVVVHELAHLKEQNHSKKFWREVEKMMPTYKHRRQWLKEKGDFLRL